MNRFRILRSAGALCGAALACLALWAAADAANYTGTRRTLLSPHHEAAPERAGP